MKFQPGDKVKFLNEKGGGIVTRIIDPATVEVAIEEGFDVPVKISNLIKVEGNSASENLFDVTFNVNPTIEKPVNTIRDVGFSKTKAADKQQAGIYLVIRPHNQKLLISGLYDIILVNHTDYDLLYNLFHRTTKGFKGADYGSIGPKASVTIDSLDKELLHPWLDSVIQLLFHKEDNTFLINPAEQSFRIKHNRLDKEDNYLEMPFVQGRCYMMRVYTMPIPGVEDEQKAVEIRPQYDTSLIEKHRKDEESAEVDLHIHALVDSTVGLSPSEMMTIQLDYVKRCLESAIVAGFERVIFIHGVGAGVLKIELRKIFEEYEFIEFFDASIAKYGIGATEVIIHKRKG
jgi:hypothetical protein